MYESYGKLLSLSFLYGYPGPKCFAPTLVSYILDHDIGSVEVDEIPDFEGRLKVAKISETKDETELKDSLSTIDERFNAGLSKISYSLMRSQTLSRVWCITMLFQSNCKKSSNSRKGWS